MARVTIEDCLEQVENRFLLVHMAAKRTRQLLDGSRPQVHAPKNKEIILALREIAEAKLELVRDTTPEKAEAPVRRRARARKR